MNELLVRVISKKRDGNGRMKEELRSAQWKRLEAAVSARGYSWLTGQRVGVRFFFRRHLLQTAMSDASRLQEQDCLFGAR